MKTRKYFFISVLSLFTVILIWYICVDVMGVVRQSVFPGPIKVFHTFINKMYMKNPDGATLPQHLLESLKVCMLGYGLAALVGIPLGIMMAWNVWVDRFVRPLFDLIRPVPGIAWIPLFLLMFGIGIFSKAFVIFLSALIPCTVNAYTGIRQTSQIHLWVGDIFGASRMQKLFKIAIPTAVPMIFTGLRVAIGSAWRSLIAAELLASNKGFGYMIQQSRALSRTDIIIVGMFAIAMVGAALDTILRKIELKVAKGMNAS
ncbi:ABC transporter permease [Lacrimispora sp.]|uniref:ABC transporter permease n=1 Tax=Lacrimispora sp. TaxID=2719234 RepID=UPI003460E72E